ncbi:uncharacterized protein LOC106648877 [Trichogramma pretiosum]|uniref:uncharacterized protein LOC106648877 n=1 Tax=Trichogramma pretiosum TaxID=7493 RepID=UPI0006C9AD15|nr:uncharacterized protein LOC106648877 [Trichogramma pretiosum]
MIQIFDSPMLNSYIFLKDIIQDVLDSYKKIKSIDLYSIRVNTLNLSAILWKSKETVVNLCCKKLQDEIRNQIKIKFGNDVNERFSIVVVIKDSKFYEFSFSRGPTSSLVLKNALEQPFKFGKMEVSKLNFTVDPGYPNDSDLNYLRLQCTKNICENVANVFEYSSTASNSIHCYLLCMTSNPQLCNKPGKVCKPILCASVVDKITKKKVKCLKQKEYLSRKCNKIHEVSNIRYTSTQHKALTEKDVERIASASTSYDLTATTLKNPVKVNIASSEDDSSIDDITMILYNLERMAAICMKYHEYLKDSIIPDLLPFESIDEMDILDDEWDLICNYIWMYPYVVRSVIKIEPEPDFNIAVLWRFVINLCHKFSKFYRNHRILMLNTSNDRVTKQITLRIYILKGLVKVLKHALDLLGVNETQV